MNNVGRMARRRARHLQHIASPTVLHVDVPYRTAGGRLRVALYERQTDGRFRYVGWRVR